MTTAMGNATTPGKYSNGGSNDGVELMTPTKSAHSVDNDEKSQSGTAASPSNAAASATSTAEVVCS